MRTLPISILFTSLLISFTTFTNTATAQSDEPIPPITQPIVLYPDNNFNQTEPIEIDEIGPPVNVRPPVKVDMNTVGAAHGPAIANDRDLSALVYVDCGVNGDHKIYVTVSDGRGMEWSEPVRVDSDPTAADKFTTRNSILVVGDNIYVAWIDERFGSGKEDLCFNVSHDKGETWEGETLIDKGYVPGTGAVRDWCMAVTRDPLENDHHVFIVLSVDPTSSSNEELYFTASHDGGLSFEPAEHLPREINRGTADVDAVALDAEGLQVSIVWQDDRNLPGNNDIFFQSSADGGMTWNTHDAPLKTVPGGSSDAGGQVDVAQIGLTIVAAWQEKRSSSMLEEIRANISIDGGKTWLDDDQLVGDYTPGVDDVDSVDVYISKDYFPIPNPPIMMLPIPVIAWDDNRSGRDEVYVASTNDYGENWVEQQISFDGGSEPVLSGGNGMMGLSFTNGSFPSTVNSSFSTDSGYTWKPSFEVSSNSGSDAKSGEIDFNYYYNNFICGWLSDDLGSDNVYVGGYRPQTLVPVGEFRRGAPVHFEAYHWGASSIQYSGETHFGILISTGQGYYSLGGKNTGLVLDAFLQISLNLNPGILSGVMTPYGGRTEEFIFPLTNTLPQVLTLHCVAVGYNPFIIPHSFGKFTDVVQIEVP